MQLRELFSDAFHGNGDAIWVLSFSAITIFLMVAFVQVITR